MCAAITVHVLTKTNAIKKAKIPSVDKDLFPLVSGDLVFLFPWQPSLLLLSVSLPHSCLGNCTDIVDHIWTSEIQHYLVCLPV